MANEENGDSDLAVFLRWEQLAAYARGGINNDWEFRGTERAKKNFNENAKIRLGTDSAALILSDQKTYGLWGLFSTIEIIWPTGGRHGTRDSFGPEVH